MTLNRSFPVSGVCIQGEKFHNQTSYHHTKRLTNLTVLMIFVLLYVFVTGCEAGCPKCGGKYPDPRLRTGGGTSEPGGAPSKLDPVEVKAFKRSFLNKLGLRRPPSRAEVARANVSAEVIEKMKRVYELSTLENNRSHELYPELDTKQFFSFTGTGVDMVIPTPTGNRSSESIKIIFGNFSLPRKRRDRIRVHSAKLQLYFKDANLPNEIAEDRGRAEIYQIVEQPRSGTTNQIRQLLDVRPVPFNNPGWVAFDIKEAVQRWEQDRLAASDSGLEILLSRPELREALVLDEAANDLHQNIEHNTFNEHHHHQQQQQQGTWRPRLDVTVRETPRRRSRRSARAHQARHGTDCHHEETTCCRYSRTVHFADLDWDYWIHSPDRYNAYYCDGSCPPGHRMATGYAVIKSQMHRVDPSQWTAPCCTASRLGTLRVLHYDSTSPDLYSVSFMDDWIVEECMCM